MGIPRCMCRSCSWHESKIRPGVMEARYSYFDSFDATSKLSDLEKRDIKGGYWTVVVAVIGAVAAVAYLYEFGYNMVDKALARSESK